MTMTYLTDLTMVNWTLMAVATMTDRTDLAFTNWTIMGVIDRTTLTNPAVANMTVTAVTAVAVVAPMTDLTNLDHHGQFNHGPPDQLDLGAMTMTVNMTIIDLAT
ncbi:hypothetical protein BDV23DRAFT_186827 [Aspergillus alliaceus]|uniref:Uncharacterized protein n=1 Tax=Petromyces alliaceus TaxID=209559 RepID=A0A5N7BYM9_PETAA|nr:hypothetical protein BDV23DRAFT_186827 [Aspergillus alliaceus]